MSIHLHNAREELKRVDHLLYVSLKYTRTVDVIKSVVDRITSCIDELIQALLAHAEEKKLIHEISSNAALRANLLKKTYDDPTIHEMVNFFVLLRKIRRSNYKKSSEYRRHVTMSVVFDEIVLPVDIDKIKEYFDATTRFLEHVEEIIIGKDDDI